jgi:PST family polysaccharide transporter
MKGPAMIEAWAKVLAALGVFLWVKGPEDGWRVLALQAIAMSVSLAWLTLWMYREIPMHRPRLAQALQTLKESAGVFLFRSSSGLYLQANAFVLGLLATPQVVAFFGGAERVIRAAMNLFHPLSQTLFPRMSHLMVADPDRAQRLLTVGLMGMGGLGIAMGITAAVGAPTLVHLILGPGYEATIPVLRVLSVLPPVIAVGTVFGIQWALPMGLERPFYLFVLSAGVINIILAVLLVPRYGAVGMAVSVMTAEILVAGCLMALFRRKGGKLTGIGALHGKGA